MTLPPGLKAATPAPTSFTTPASSLPGENGSGGLNWYLFWMMRTSGKLTLAAFTEITTSPGPGRGEGSSSTTSDSGGPSSLHRTAFMLVPAGGLAAVDGKDATRCIGRAIGGEERD